MNTDRIKEIQKETFYPDSVSVREALLKVWNECEQVKGVKENSKCNHNYEPCEHESVQTFDKCTKCGKIN